MTASSAAPGTVPPLQLLGVPQSPPAGLTQVIVAGTVRSSSASSRSRRGGAFRMGRRGAVRVRAALSGRSQVATVIERSPSVGGPRYSGDDGATGAQTERRGRTGGPTAGGHVRSRHVTGVAVAQF